MLKVYCNKPGHAVYPLEYEGEVQADNFGNIDGTIYVDTSSCWHCENTPKEKELEEGEVSAEDATLIPKGIGNFYEEMEMATYNLDRIVEIVEDEIKPLVRKQDMDMFKSLLEDMNNLREEAMGYCMKYYREAKDVFNITYKTRPY